MKPEITLIKKSGPNPVMSKRIFLDEQGKVCSDGSQSLMAQGTATRATAETAAELAQHITACGTDRAIVLGTLRADLPNPAQITTGAKLKDNPGAIMRSRDFIDYPPGAPAWALIDFDTKGMPPNVAASIEAAGGMWNALLTVARVCWSKTSKSGKRYLLLSLKPKNEAPAKAPFGDDIGI